MSMSLKILLIYAVWFAAIFYVHRICKKSRSGSVGAPLSYLITMSFLHCGGLLYAIPGYSHLRTGGYWYLQTLNFTDGMVFSGIVASAISVIGIALGCRLCPDKGLPAAAHMGPIPPLGPRSGRGPQPPRRPLGPYTRLPLMMLALGLVSFFVTKLNIPLPSVQSIVMAGRNLAVVGVCFGLWLAWQRGNRDGLKLWTAMTLVVPIAYLVGFGFLSYGFTAMAIFLAFWLSTPKRGAQNRLLTACIIAVGLYASLSMFVGYMEVRGPLREVLWNNDARMSQRISSVITELSGIRPLNPLNFTQLDWINVRLNQNMLIGKAMWLHDIYPGLQENGLGLLASIFAWVPRFLWPSKPIMGGNDFVEIHTDMSFSDNTTIGAGPVFELFVNFGLIGVFLGSIVLGWVLRWMDAYCARQLHRRDIGRFIRGFLVSVCLINPMSLIFFLVSSASAAWVLGTGIMIAMDMTKERIPMGRPPPPPRRPETEKQILAS